MVRLLRRREQGQGLNHREFQSHNGAIAALVAVFGFLPSC